MKGRQAKDARILAYLALPDRFEIVIPAGVGAVQIDPDRLARADTIVVSAQGGETGKARDLLKATASRLRPGAFVALVLNGLSPSLLQGGLAGLLEMLEQDGYAIIDVLGGADAVLVALRHAPTLDADEMTVWVAHRDQEASLIYPQARDMMRRMAVASHRFYEAELLEHIEARYRGGTVIDAGANLGNHSVFLAKMTGATVHAFEPAPEVFACLAANVAANGLAGRVVCHALALGAEQGHGAMAPAPAGNIAAARFVPGASAAIAMTTLDKAMADVGRVDLIKIDVEGMEEQVLRGGAALIARHEPDLFVEILDAARLESITRWLADFGYRRLRSHTGNPTWEFTAKP